MNTEQEKLVADALGAESAAFEVRSEGGFLPGRYLKPEKLDDESIVAHKDRIIPILDKFRIKARESDVRLFIGSFYPLLTDLRSEDCAVLYAIPDIQQDEFIELFEVGQCDLVSQRYEDFLLTFQELQFKQDASTSEQAEEKRAERLSNLTGNLKPSMGAQINWDRFMDRRTYNDLIVKRPPWRRIRTGLRRICDRYQFEILSISPQHVSIALLEYPATEKEAKWYSNQIVKINRPLQEAAADGSLWKAVMKPGTLTLRWDQRSISP